MATAAMGRAANAELPTDLLMGAVAGAAAIWAMNRLDWFLVGQEPERVRRRTRDARPGGLDLAHVVAGRAARMVGARLSPAQPHPAGVAVYYGFGVLMAAAHATFGLVADTVLRLLPRPRA